VPHSITQDYSSIVVNQNQAIDSTVVSAVNSGYMQEFHLPPDYRRGTESGELRYPSLSGFQLLVEVAAGCSRYAAFDYDVQYQVFGLGWVSVTSGVGIGAPTDGLTWMTVHFESPVDIDTTKATARWRLIFGSGRPVGLTDRHDEIVTYANGEANVLGTRVVVDLVSGDPYHFVHNAKPAFLYLDPFDNQVYFSYEQGVERFVITSPNPLTLPNGDRAWNYNGAALNGTNGAAAFNFRVLGLTAEDGIDFLGNQFRSVVIQNEANNISTALGADPDSFWLSKPNPSKFAIENLYFDIRKPGSMTYDPITFAPIENDPQDAATVIDRVLIDPITPGTYFHIYYADEGDPGSSDDQWEGKLWTRVPQTYRMERRETHVFPEPVRAKYLKIEFSHLQARYYAPGDFQQPIRYKKHPKWVLDYFLARMQTDAAFLAERVAVVYDALDLAYNYYLDDLGQEPQTAIDVNDSVASGVTSFLSDRSDVSDRIDPITLDKINLALEPYRDHPALRGTATTLLGDYARQTVSTTDDYSVETARARARASADVSSLNRDRVVIEQNYPVMFFYLTCRHAYREIEAKLTHDRAYFVGVRQIAFLRDNYMTAFDTGTYIEPAADTQNIERNEF
jgi:hypothetical protein